MWNNFREGVSRDSYSFIWFAHVSWARASVCACIYEFGQCLCAFVLEIDASENPKKLIRVSFFLSIGLTIPRV